MGEVEVCQEEIISDRTLVLVGKTGNGKSATANMILGRKAFKSMPRAIGVTKTCELQSTTLSDGSTINVIDTPGMFDLSLGTEYIAKEIVRCLSLAKDGIDGMLLVFSARNRLTEEEESTLTTLYSLFGRDILNYLTVVFTGGDDLEDSEQTLDDYLTNECPSFLKEILALCDNRMVLFDNRTKSKRKKERQVQELLSLVDSTVRNNGGKRYTDEFHQQIQKETTKFSEEQKKLQEHSNLDISEFSKRLEKSYEERLQRITVLVQARMIDIRKILEKNLSEQKAARIEAEKKLADEQKRSKEEIEKLRNQLEKESRSSCRLL